jgi:hypothetical protein
MGEKVLVICPTPQARFTATHWHDGQFAHGAHARIARRANQFAIARFIHGEQSTCGNMSYSANAGYPVRRALSI